jgi:hypothetical protein
MRFTPAFFAASMTFRCCAARRPTSLAEISSSVSIPGRALSSVPGRS